MKTGAKLSFGNGELTAEVVGEVEGGNRLIRFDYEGIFLEVLEQLGKMPLPPYIKAELQDRERSENRRVVSRAKEERRGNYYLMGRIPVLKDEKSSGGGHR